MTKKKLNLKFGIVALMIFVAALSRLIPHPPNVSAVGGMALFGAAYFSKKYWAFIIPIVALFLSDLLLNNILLAQYYDGFVFMTPGWYWIYGSFALIALMGFVSLKKVKPMNLVGSSLLASTIFYLVTNFGSWMGPFVPEGQTLLMTYIAGLPFYLNTIVGDLIYVGVLFGAFAWVKNTYFAEDIASA